jgi:hypothetical protein
MGFALWLTADLAWAQGTHEYKPMGAAVVARSGLFRARDFSPKRRPPARNAEGFAGLFASLEDVNRHLIRGRSQGEKKNRRKAKRLVIATF